MPQLTTDLSNEACPDYKAEEWEIVRQALVAGHQNQAEPLTNKGAIEWLKIIWQMEHNRKVTQWIQEREEDQVAEDECIRLEREEEEQRKAEKEKEEEEHRKELDQKKLKLNNFNPSRRIDNWIAAWPSTYALNKLQQFEYIELDYFMPKGYSLAHAEHEKTSNNDTFSIPRVNEIIALQLMSSLKPSKDIWRDEDLSWDKMIMAKNTMLHFITKSGVWQKEHVHSLVAFFVVLKNHPMCYWEMGNKIILQYISQVQREWFNTLKEMKASTSS